MEISRASHASRSPGGDCGGPGSGHDFPIQIVEFAFRLNIDQVGMEMSITILAQAYDQVFARAYEKQL